MGPERRSHPNDATPAGRPPGEFHVAPEGGRVLLGERPAADLEQRWRGAVDPPGWHSWAAGQYEILDECRESSQVAGEAGASPPRKDPGPPHGGPSASSRCTRGRVPSASDALSRCAEQAVFVEKSEIRSRHSRPMYQNLIFGETVKWFRGDVGQDVRAEWPEGLQSVKVRRYGTTSVSYLGSEAR